MAEAMQPVQNPVMAEIQRRKAIIGAAQPGADKQHRENLGVQPKEPPKPPRHVELAPAVDAALKGMTVEAWSKLRLSGELPAEVQEAREVVPSPKRDALALREFKNADRNLVAPHNVHPMLLDCNPAFWSPISDQLQIYDKVTVVAPDDRWLAEFIVTRCGENSAEAKLLWHITIDPKQHTSDHEWLGGDHELVSLTAEHPMPGFAIKRKRDGLLMMQSGTPFKDIEEARTYWKSHAINRRDEQPQYFP